MAGLLDLSTLLNKTGFDLGASNQGREYTIQGAPVYTDASGQLRYKDSNEIANGITDDNFGGGQRYQTSSGLAQKPVNALSDYINNQLYGSVLGRQAEAGAADFWANTAQQNGWDQQKLTEEFNKAAQIEIANRPQTTTAPAVTAASNATTNPYRAKLAEVAALTGKTPAEIEWLDNVTGGVNLMQASTEDAAKYFGAGGFSDGYKRSAMNMGNAAAGGARIVMPSFYGYDKDGNFVGDKPGGYVVGERRDPSEVAAEYARTGKALTSFTPESASSAIKTAALTPTQSTQYSASAQPAVQAAATPPTTQAAPSAAYTPPARTAGTEPPAPAYTPYTSQAFNFEADPGYAFRKAEGEKALQARQLSSGNFFSGGAMKELNDFNSGLASQEVGNAFTRYMSKDASDFRNHQANYNNEFSRWKTLDDTGYDRAWNNEMRDYNRFNDQFNRDMLVDNTNWSRLQYLDQSGQNAATQTANLGQHTSSNVGDLMNLWGGAQAGGYINSSNSWTNALGNALYALRK